MLSFEEGLRNGMNILAALAAVRGWLPRLPDKRISDLVKKHTGVKKTKFAFEKQQGFYAKAQKL